MDEAALARLNIIEGEMDFLKLYHEITAGTGVIVGIYYGDGEMKANMPMEGLDFIEVGDTISARVDGKVVKTYTIAAKAVK